MQGILVKVAERICYGFGFGIGMGTAWRLLPVRKKTAIDVHEGSTMNRTQDVTTPLFRGAREESRTPQIPP